MVRFIAAFLLALVCHLLLFLLPYRRQDVIIPQLSGRQAITIQLDNPRKTVAPEVVEEDVQPQKMTIPQPPFTNKKSPPANRRSASLNKPAVELPPGETKASLQKAKHSQPVQYSAVPPKKISQPRTTARESDIPDHPSPQKQQNGLATSNVRQANTTPSPAQPVLVEATPLYQENTKPVYPMLARRRGWEGTVTLRVLVKKDGLPDGVHVLSSSGYGLLDKAALQAVTQWRFLPGTKNGHPAEMEVLVPVHFQLAQE